MNPSPQWMFLLFAASGFSSLLYETLWTRLAMASFGVTTPVVSVVLSIFMAGLAIGAWLGGRPVVVGRSLRRLLVAYALVELVVALGSLTVPWLFATGRQLLLGRGEMASTPYHVASGLLIAAAVLPWTIAMGVTLPLGVAVLGRVTANETRRARSFSYYYLANVLGAAAGTLASAFVLVELGGFQRTLRLGGAMNFSLFLAALWLARHAPAGPREEAPAPIAEHAVLSGRPLLAALFVTGFASMGLELAWTRLFAHYIGTFVYSFAGILTVYLLGTYAGTALYRRRAARGKPLAPPVRLIAALAPLGLVPLAAADPRFVPPVYMQHGDSPWLVITIAPLCLVLGYLSPLLIDTVSAGSPRLAARAYAVNVVGCILGPLATGYLLLPRLGEHHAIAFLALLPLATLLVLPIAASERRHVALMTLAGFALAFFARTYDQAIRGAVVRRDATATVVASGVGPDKRLLVNGVGITMLTTATKLMAHVPLAHLDRSPESALVICFGMGTTFRSLASWGMPVTAVELAPSVADLFGYFFDDAERVRASGRIVIDDGRRFLDRTNDESADTFDVIAVDPPPPIEAAGSSLLYSREFYRSAKHRLAPGGILQQWCPEEKSAVVGSVVQAMRLEFADVRVIALSRAGLILLGSDRPIPRRSAVALAARLPAPARADLLEWLPGYSAEQIFARLLASELDVARVAGDAPPLTDDRPYNEYFALRRFVGDDALTW